MAGADIPSSRIVAAIFFAEYLPYLLVVGFLILVFRQPGARRKFYLFAEGALAVILARGIVTESIRFFYNVARPFALLGFSPLIGESGSSFPSGHMAWFFALASSYGSRTESGELGSSCSPPSMGIARIYAGVHWPLDILARYVVGLLRDVSSIGCSAARERRDFSRPKNRQRKSRPLRDIYSNHVRLDHHWRRSGRHLGWYLRRAEKNEHVAYHRQLWRPVGGFGRHPELGRYAVHLRI